MRVLAAILAVGVLVGCGESVVVKEWDQGELWDQWARGVEARFPVGGCAGAWAGCGKRGVGAGFAVEIGDCRCGGAWTGSRVGGVAGGGGGADGRGGGSLRGAEIFLNKSAGSALTRCGL